MRNSIQEDNFNSKSAVKIFKKLTALLFSNTQELKPVIISQFLFNRQNRAIQ
ncbi:hypothetical protein HMPREF1052_1307 [Pasteurella bettyae CCUG 2042]|uniref:Uncharacterized protein n=1 Tax=Pasteurella bettyae CCUG 2042 TaxID=1095749 RepID=I3DAP6_9PAST|nr:hypothetical protein HMPREF1052_1307 [Pasteurella bettyae CCUG 2042]